MSIIGPLLTGGILIGKICQSLAQIIIGSSQQSDPGIVGEVSSGGVTFYRIVNAGISEIRAFNRSTSLPAVITIPNGTNGDGVTYVLAPTQTIPFPEASAEAMPPETSVMAGAVTTSDTPAAQGGKDALFKLAFSGLTKSTGVNVGSFNLSCNTTQLIITTTGLTINALTYMSIQSNKGVSASSTSTVPAKPIGPGSDVSKAFEFDVDFEDLGIETGRDSFGGILAFTMDASMAELLKLSKTPSRELDAVERAYFMKG